MYCIVILNFFPHFLPELDFLDTVFISDAVFIAVKSGTRFVVPKNELMKFLVGNNSFALI